jgi:hypothetical protein
VASTKTPDIAWTVSTRRDDRPYPCGPKGAFWSQEEIEREGVAMTALFSKSTSRSADPSGSWFDDHAATWIERGLVSSEQVDAIRAFERAHEPAPARLSIVAELAVYLGSVLALMSGAVLVGQSWDSLALAGRIAIGAAVAILGFVAGARLVRIGDAGARRLASFMWVIGTGGVALVAGTLADAAELDEPGWNLLIVGIPVLTIGAMSWRNLDRPLQVLTTAIGSGLTIGAIGALLSTPAWLGGVLVWLLALAVGTLAVTQRLRPELYVLAVASIAAMIGALMLTDVSEVGGAAAATVTAAGIVLVGLARHLTPILVIGVLTFLQSLQGLLMITLNGTVGAMVVAVVGLAIVAVVIVRSTRGRAPQPP